MDAISAALFGLLLAACAGLRAFLPVLAAGLGARLMDLPLPPQLEWLTRTEALLVFAVATLLEILGDKVPVVDHLLDSVQTLVHATKATVRAGTTATTAGLGNPVVSVIEDVVATAAIVIGLLAPVLGLLLIGVLCLVLVRFALRVRRALRRPPA